MNVVTEMLNDVSWFTTMDKPSDETWVRCVRALVELIYDEYPSSLSLADIVFHYSTHHGDSTLEATAEVEAYLMILGYLELR